MLTVGAVRNRQVKDEAGIRKLEEALQKANYDPASAALCRHAGRGNCRFQGNCWSIHASEGTSLMSGALPPAGGSGGAFVASGGVARCAPACSYSLPRAGEAGHGGGVTAITIATDKNWLVSGSEDGSVLCWDLAAGVTPGPTCAAAVTALLYADGWLFCATQAGGITGHNTA